VPGGPLKKWRVKEKSREQLLRKNQPVTLSRAPEKDMKNKVRRTSRMPEGEGRKRERGVSTSSCVIE